MATQAEIDLGTRIIELITAAGGIGGGGGGSPEATSLVTGTVKTDVTELHPVVYTKATVDTNFYTKTAADARYALAAHTHTFASLTSKPTTIGGYGITDFNSLGDARWAAIATTLAGYGITNAYTKTESDALYSVLGHTHTFASLTAKPTTIGGFGITDFNSLGDARWALLAHVHAGTDITTGLIAAARLGSGSGGATKFLREDQSWQAVAGGGAAAVKTAEVDFGSRTLREGTFAIADATVAGGQKITAWQSGEAATGRDADEAEFASFIVVPRSPVAGVGFTAYCRALGDLCELQGKFKINYLLG